MQQIIRTASSELMYCLCKSVICRIQQFPCNKLLKKRYVIPRYNNLCADSRLNLIWTFSMTFCSSSCLSKVEHLIITFFLATDECFIKQIGEKKLRVWLYVWYNHRRGTAIYVLKYPPPPLRLYNALILQKLLPLLLNRTGAPNEDFNLDIRSFCKNNVKRTK